MDIKNYSMAQFVEEFAINEISREAYEDITGLSLSEYQKTQKQYADPKYQRIFGAWNHQQKCSFIESVFHNEAYNPIVLAEILNADDRLPRSIKFACLDGQHRSTVICEFVDNKFGFTGSLIVDGEKRDFTNTLFKDLDDRIRKLFLTRAKICVTIVKDKSECDLRNIFLQINSGEPLNRQEKRNAMDTHIAKWSRKQTDKHKDVFKQVTGIGSKMHRMADRQLVSKVALFLSSYDGGDIVGTADKELDDFYNLKKYDLSMLNYISDNLLSGLGSVAKAHKQRNNSRMRMEHLWCYCIIHYKLFYASSNSFTKHTKEIPSTTDIYDFCQDLVATLVDDSENNYAQMKSDRNSGKITEEQFNAAKFFHAEKGRVHMANSMRTYEKEIVNLFGDNTDSLAQRIVAVVFPSLALAG